MCQKDYDIVFPQKSVMKVNVILVISAFICTVLGFWSFSVQKES